MKILLTSAVFFPSIGGIETMALLLAKYFLKSGHSVRIITNTLHDDTAFPFMDLSIFRRPSILKTLECVKWSDVIFQVNLETRLFWPFLFFRRPLVVGLQTWVRTSEGKRTLIQRLKLLCLMIPDEIIACSNAVRKDSAYRAHVIPSPFNSDLFRILPNKNRRQSIAFLGRLVSDKGVDLLIKAFSKLPDNNWELTVIGDGPDRQYLKNLSYDLGVGDCVDFVGSVQGESLVDLLNEHQILVVPSQWKEPFGIVVLEGLACGCTVLASDGGGLPDAVGSAGILFRRGDLVDLQNKLHSLLFSPEISLGLRANVPQHLMQFHHKKISHLYLDVLLSAYQKFHNA